MDTTTKNNHNYRNLPEELQKYGFFISEELHHQEIMPSYHAHPHYEILYIFSGAKNLTINNNLKYKLDLDNIMLLKPHVLHQTKSLSPNFQQRILIHIDNHIIDEFQKFAFPHIIDCFNTPVLKLSSYSRKLINYFLKSLVSLSPGAPDYIAKGKVLLVNLLMFLSNEYKEQNNEEIQMLKKSEQDYALQITEYVTNNFNKPITISDIANKFHFSKTHVSRIFKNVMNTTLHKYIVSIRIIKAKEMLHKDNASVHTVAERCGFNSPEAFTRTFKQHMGLSPSEYIKTKTILEDQ